ncbi:MAG: sn-glycerol-3-phosphate ABC transporter ATP-binding protein UgpC [Myxococcota bacterium]
MSVQTPEPAARVRPRAEVVLDHVVKRYAGNVVAVKSISLEIKDGEFVVLVGPSGCGKTTTLRMIAGLEDITEGTLSIGGKVVNNVPPRDRDIAMVFQSYALYPHMSVRENMAFGLELRKMPKAEIARRVDEAAKMLELGDLLNRKPKALSGGQRQRVAMGRAVVRQPAVFLFDEPLSNLDAKLRVQMRVEIAALHRRVGATMVYVTHDQVEAMTLADRIAVMSTGELQQFASPMEVYHRPANQFVAGFIGSPGMNFVNGTTTAEGDGLVFRGEGLTVVLEPDHVARIKKAATVPVVLGLRPQHLHFAPEGTPSIGAGTVGHVELMGAETFAHVHFDSAGAGKGATVVVALPGEMRVVVGDRLAVGIDAKRVHAFDTAGRNLTVIPLGEPHV